jgi:hypothetical protein
VPCLDEQALETNRSNCDEPCWWALIADALRQQIPELPTQERGDAEAFVELLDGLAALEAQRKRKAIMAEPPRAFTTYL